MSMIQFGFQLEVLREKTNYRCEKKIREEFMSSKESWTLLELNIPPIPDASHVISIWVK